MQTREHWLPKASQYFAIGIVFWCNVQVFFFFFAQHVVLRMMCGGSGKGGGHLEESQPQSERTIDSKSEIT